MHDIQIIVDDISLSIRKLLKKYSALLNYESHQNQEAFIYRIENQIQCSHTMRLHYTILHPIVPEVQHPF